MEHACMLEQQLIFPYPVFFSRQLRDTVDWLTSESMILFYIRYFQDSMWPDGVLAPPQQPPSLEEQRATQKEAREKFLQNLPGKHA